MEKSFHTQTFQVGSRSVECYVGVIVSSVHRQLWDHSEFFEGTVPHGQVCTVART